MSDVYKAHIASQIVILLYAVDRAEPLDWVIGGLAVVLIAHCVYRLALMRRRTAG